MHHFTDTENCVHAALYVLPDTLMGMSGMIKSSSMLKSGMATPAVHH